MSVPARSFCLRWLQPMGKCQYPTLWWRRRRHVKETRWRYSWDSCSHCCPWRAAVSPVPTELPDVAVSSLPQLLTNIKTLQLLSGKIKKFTFEPECERERSQRNKPVWAFSALTVALTVKCKQVMSHPVFVFVECLNFGSRQAPRHFGQMC